MPFRQSVRLPNHTANCGSRDSSGPGQSGITRKLKLAWPSLRSGPRSLTRSRLARRVRCRPGACGGRERMPPDLEDGPTRDEASGVCTRIGGRDAAGNKTSLNMDRRFARTPDTGGLPAGAGAESGPPQGRPGWCCTSSSRPLGSPSLRSTGRLGGGGKPRRCPYASASGHFGQGSRLLMGSSAWRLHSTVELAQ
jgi:hypothetical protein